MLSNNPLILRLSPHATTCSRANVFGYALYPDEAKKSTSDYQDLGIVWKTFRSNYHSMRALRMKIRPLNFDTEST